MFLPLSILIGLIYDLGKKINVKLEYIESVLFGKYQPPLLKHQNIYIKIIIDCIIVSFGFAIIESLFRYFKDGSYTTWEQFIMNIFYTPIMIYTYKKIIKRYFLRVILFPFNVWIAEIIMGSYLFYLHGYRVWIYTDTLALFNGFISISFAHYWLLLGIFVFLVL